jgi:hypothetical protein
MVKTPTQERMRKMVCASCATAGKLTAVIKHDINNHTQSERVLHRTALRLHGECPGGTWCDCAHVLSAPIAG